jgi:IclR family acetate operon transcriptional repressor
LEIRALTRAARILASISVSPTGQTLSEIASSVDLSKATTHRFVQALVTIDYLRSDSRSATYHIGPALLSFANAGAGLEELRALAGPVLKELRTATLETASLVVPSGLSRLTVEVELSEHELRAVPEPGGIKPIHAGAAGKALLAWYPEETLQGLLRDLELRAVTPRTITTAQELLRELTRIRSRGYAVSSGETEPGQAASAAPIFNADGTVLGCLNISGPASRLPAATLRANGELAVAAAKKLGSRLSNGTKT